MKQPSIVAPGGSYHKAIIALDYGADAVYVGSQHFSLRKSADNLSMRALTHLCQYAQSLSKKVYLAINIFPHESDISGLIKLFESIKTIPLSALIISDLGVCQLARDYTDIPIHASTQASITNIESASLWKSMGAKRIVLAREATLKETQRIKNALNIETEVFIHGAMCSSFSGKCTISNVTSGRDSNRGGCVQSCRHQYQLSNGDSLAVMNSKDLQGLACIPDYFNANVDALKIEGRMKSALYVANTVQQYRLAIDSYAKNPALFNQQLPLYESALNRVSNRGFTSANLINKAGKDSISYQWNGYHRSIEIVGIVKSHTENTSLIEVKNPIYSGQSYRGIAHAIRTRLHHCSLFNCIWHPY